MTAVIGHRPRVSIIVLLLAVTGCVQAIRISVGAGNGQGPPPTDADISTAANLLDRIAKDYDFERHQDEQRYIEDSRQQAWVESYDVAVYAYAGSEWEGRLTLFLSADKRDGHLLVAITNLDAYGSSAFVASLEQAIVGALAEAFPEKRIHIDRSRGVSPLGP